MASKKTKVIILGGGLAGLSAGFNLKKNNIDFIILEARDRLGGRVWTKKLKEENLHLELGGEWIGKNHKNIINFCKFFNLELIDHSFNTSIYINNEYKKSGNWNFEPKWEERYKKIFKNIDKFSLEELDKISWKDLLLENKISQYNLKLRDLIDSTDFGEDISNVSAAVALKDFSRGGETHNLDFTIKNGNSILVDSFENFIDSKNIKLNTQVEVIKQTLNNVEVIDQNNNVYYAEKIICTLPTFALTKIKMEPNLSPEKLNILRDLKYGRINKTALVFSGKFWEDESFEVITDKLPHYIYNTSKLQNSNSGILTSYSIGDKAFVMSKLNNLQKEVKIKKVLGNIFDKSKIKSIKSISYYWGDDPYTKGAFAIYGPGQFLKYQPLLKDDFKNIIFAGEHLAVEQGYMEGAVETGIIASERLI